MPLNQSLNECNEKLETNAVLRRYQGEEQEGGKATTIYTRQVLSEPLTS